MREKQGLHTLNKISVREGAFFLAHFFIALRKPLDFEDGFFTPFFCRDLQPCFLHEGKLGQTGHFVNDMRVSLCN